MKKKHKSKTPRRNNSNRLILSFLVAAVLSFAAWATNTATAVRLPDAGVASEIYASENQEDLRHLFRTAIESAKESVYLLVYTLTDESIIQALKARAANGVKVEVIVDAKASPFAAQKLGNDVKTLRRLGVGLMHCKILIVDKHLVWIGSANMTRDSLQMHSNLVIGMDSPALADYLITKAVSQVEAGRSTSLHHQTFRVGGQDIEFWFLPDDATLALRRIKDLIRTAEKTIRVAMFTWTRIDFAHEIIRAAKRGVKVQVVIDNNSGKGASAKVVQLLKDNGIDVRMSKGIGLLHHKFMEVDRSTLVNGSANWTRAAFGSNDDCFLIIDDLTTSQREKLDDEWKVLYADSEAA